MRLLIHVPLDSCRTRVPVFRESCDTGVQDLMSRVTSRVHVCREEEEEASDHDISKGMGKGKEKGRATGKDHRRRADPQAAAQVSPSLPSPVEGLPERSEITAHCMMTAHCMIASVLRGCTR